MLLMGIGYQRQCRGGAFSLGVVAEGFVLSTRPWLVVYWVVVVAVGVAGPFPMFLQGVVDGFRGKALLIDRGRCLQ